MMDLMTAKKPLNWNSEIVPTTLKRRNYRCCECGAVNRSTILRLNDHEILSTDSLISEWALRTGAKTTKIIVQVVPYNGFYTDTRHENLLCLCQYCRGKLIAKFNGKAYFDILGSSPKDLVKRFNDGIPIDSFHAVRAKCVAEYARLCLYRQIVSKADENGLKSDYFRTIQHEFSESFSSLTDLIAKMSIAASSHFDTYDFVSQFFANVMRLYLPPTPDHLKKYISMTSDLAHFSRYKASVFANGD